MLVSDEEMQVGDFTLKSTLLKIETSAVSQAAKQENPSVKTKRLTQQSRFWLKEALAQRGESAAFLHWLGTDSGKHA